MPFQPILQSEWCQHEILCKLLSFCLVNLIQQPSVQWHSLLLLSFGLQLTALVLVWLDPIQVKKRNRQISYWKLHFIEFKIMNSINVCQYGHNFISLVVLMSLV